MYFKLLAIPSVKSVFVLAVCLLICCLGLPPSARAADQVVTNLNDDGPGSLRQAVVDVGDGEEITFDVTGTITLTSGRITIAKNLTITGPGARQLIIDGDGNYQIFRHTAGNFSISGLSLTNVATDSAYCVYSSDGTISISDCRLEGVNGGGLVLSSGNNGFSVNRCLFTNCNTHGAQSGAGIMSWSNNGTVTNCTFTGNVTDLRGGGLGLVSGGIVKISHCTIVNNESQINGGGGIYQNSGTTVQLKNTIVAGNTDSSGNGRHNLYGTFTSEDYNLIGDETGGTWNVGPQSHDTVNVADPKVATLANNCGPTDTMALLEGSPALDKGVGTDVDGNPVTVDQRGAERPWETEYDIGAFEYNPNFTCNDSSDDGSGGDPDPDPTPPGGPANQLGGGGDNMGPPLPPGYTWAPNGQGDTPQDMTMALANQGGGTQPASGKAKMEEALPGLMFRQTCPAGSSQESWLALGQTGTTPSGVEYSTSVRWNYDVRVIDLDLNWPQEVIGNMAAGKHCLCYWLQTTEGLCSNCRVGYLDLSTGPDTATVSFARATPVPLSATELTFKLQLGYFNKSTGFVDRVASGMCNVETEDGTWGTFPIADGLLTFTIPFGVTSKVGFNSVTFNGTKTVRMEFKDGYLYCFDQDHRDATVEVYQCVDGESYALEYYRDLVYICNQGEDPDGPILGRMYGK